MESLIIEATEDSPAITFDIKSNRFIISGKSRPENTGKFYTPVINWITQYEEILSSPQNRSADHPNQVFIFKMDYFNSISAKYILDIITVLKDFIMKGYKINIEWHFSKLDDDMFETGKEFSNMVNLKFDFIAY